MSDILQEDSYLISNSDESDRWVNLSPTYHVGYPDIVLMDIETVPCDISLYGGVFGRVRPKESDEIALHVTDEYLDDDELVEQTINILSHEYMHKVLLDLVGTEAYRLIDNVENTHNFLRTQTDKFVEEKAATAQSIRSAVTENSQSDSSQKS